MIKKIPKDYFDPSKGVLKLLWEDEWRGLGITQVQTDSSWETKARADNLDSEPRMGTLRGSRTRAPYPPFQVCPTDIIID